MVWSGRFCRGGVARGLFSRINQGTGSEASLSLTLPLRERERFERGWYVKVKDTPGGQDRQVKAELLRLYSASNLLMVSSMARPVCSENPWYFSATIPFLLIT